MIVKTRAQWGAQPGKRPLTPWHGTPLSVTIHYEGTNIPIPKRDYSDNVWAIQNYHLHGAKDDYSDIAYNLLVDPNGIMYEGRGMSFQSGANGTRFANESSIAICYIGGPDNPLTAEAAIALEEWNRTFLAARPEVPHHYWIQTSCPGAHVDDWLKFGINGPPVTTTPVPPPPATATGGFLGMLADKIAFLKIAILRRSIQYGDKNSAVGVVQLELAAHGFYKGEIDNSFGPMTYSSVRSFQLASGLTADGIVGPKTFAALTK